MNNCRICLTQNVSKYMAELPDYLNNETKPNIEEIMLFCLDIEMSSDTESTTKLCTKCFYSVVYLYKFKLLAVKNNKYLQTLKTEMQGPVKLENLFDDDTTECGLDGGDGEVEGVLLSTKDELNLLYEAIVNENQQEEKMSTLKKTKKKPGRPRKAVAATVKQSKKRSTAVKSNNNTEDDAEDTKNLDVICGEMDHNIPAHLQEHCKNPAKKDIVKCQTCNVLFESRKKMLRHYWDEHADAKNIECSKCNMLVRCISLHNRRAHKELPAAPCGHCARREAKGQKPKFQCDECPKTFQMRHRLLRHSRMVHSKQETMQCAYCDKVFTRYCLLQEHEAAHTVKDPSRVDNPQIDAATGISGLMFKCKQCGDEFENKALWIEHRDSAHAAPDAASGRQRCELCFKFYVDLRGHKLAVHEKHKRPFGCDQCGDRFLGKRALEEHRRRHAGERPLQCPRCPKRFSVASVLDTHVKAVHEKQLAFICHYCSKRFFRKEYLQRHMVVHSTERPFACVKCDKRFKDTTCLRNHLRTHSDERNFECKICHKYYRTPALLKSHMLTHSSARALVCRYCPAAFKRGDYRLDHERKKHLDFLNTLKENQHMFSS